MTTAFLDLLDASRTYPITDRLLSGRSHAEQVAEFADRGVKLVQLREKNLSSGEFYREAEQAMLVAHRNGIKIIINDRVDIALAVNADGVHLGQDDLPVEAARHLLGADVVIGFSTHSLAQAREAARLPIDYLAIGPIFPTSTKKSSNSAVGLAGLAAVRQAVPGIPLVAIGGIDAANRAAVIAAGADAVAAISDLWPR
ncbi:MAG: thiamine-phosphate pyrophosphorylase [Pyrinomonadaceae bacterium]|nr:thiamine-phosphate pyrophosphorylase [Pyrinomonadaceae bacterium]